MMGNCHPRFKGEGKEVILVEHGASMNMWRGGSTCRLQAQPYSTIAAF